MILLVIGLVAVIVVVLIAVILSIRLGRGDEDDEPDVRSGGRDRRRDQDDRSRERDTQRVHSSARTSGRNSASRGRGDGYDGYGSRGPGRERDYRGRDGGSRGPAGPEAPGYRRPAAARSAVGASAPARGRHDTGPSRRPADDFPSADHPSMDFGPAGGHPADDRPSGEFTAVGYGAMDDSRDRPAARRKASPAPAAGKNRSRQRGKRGDDDDWPSTDWDKLSDEQYWAELSADKPLASMARPSKAAKDAPANGRGRAKPAVRDARPARPPAPERDVPSRKERTSIGEPATERLPVRTGARQAPPAPLPPRREPDAAAASRSYPEPHAALDTGPHPLRDTGPRPRRDTGPQPRAGQRRRDTTGPQATRDRDLAMLNGLASAPPPIPGALEDDPLTSPSFSTRSVPASDSRSYGNARKHAKTTGQPARGAAHGNGNGSGSYPAADYASPGHAYQAAPMPAAPPPAAAADWYGGPPAPAAPPAEAQASSYGNPYRYNGPAAGPAGDQATEDYSSYLADPLRVYSPHGYQTPGPYAEPAPPAGGTAPYADGYPGHPYADHAGYQAGYGTNGHVPGYQEGYQADPYAGGGYGPYPPQG